MTTTDSLSIYFFLSLDASLSISSSAPLDSLSFLVPSCMLTHTHHLFGFPSQVAAAADAAAQALSTHPTTLQYPVAPSKKRTL